MARTEWPCLRRVRHSNPPTKPDAPVTTTFFILPVLSYNTLVLVKCQFQLNIDACKLCLSSGLVNQKPQFKVRYY
ncbi:hypothetical protein SADUNF_Sadunf02G0108000 [Salix dunnii]|uniref:Uncharacterized protein n=1 Tax=Salix dunnii TaxID=1413687 RepID=A0A835N799_9ROSI|nr:hypothetical protein SADUNF_Sadunf02G0108000 [Salix dunnii]